jgi:hypothetical protein
MTISSLGHCEDAGQFKCHRYRFRACDSLLESPGIFADGYAFDSIYVDSSNTIAAAISAHTSI